MNKNVRTLNWKRIFRVMLASLLFFSVFCIHLSAEEEEEAEEEKSMYIESRADLGLEGTIIEYKGNYEGEELELYVNYQTKSYMDWRSINSRGSRQYKYIQENMYVDQETGLLFDEDGFIGAALGSYYGEIGDKFLFYLESGYVVPIVKIEEKSNSDCDPMGAYALADYSIIEFLIDKRYANEYFGVAPNGYILYGNFNKYEYFHGHIEKIEKVTKCEEADEEFVPDPSIIEKIQIDLSLKRG